MILRAATFGRAVRLRPVLRPGNRGKPTAQRVDAQAPPIVGPLLETWIDGAQREALGQGRNRCVSAEAGPEPTIALA
jgi:hypothetical protein